MADLKPLPRPTEPQFLRMLNFVFRPIDYLEYYGKQFGDIFAVGSEYYPFVYLNHPRAIEEIFTRPPEQFSCGAGNAVLGFILGANSLVLMDGEKHRQQKKLLMPPFHGERLKAYEQIIIDLTLKSTDSWQEGSTFLIRPLLQEITLGVILQAVFGVVAGNRYQRLKTLLGELLETLGSPLSSALLFYPFLRREWSWSPWGRFLCLKQEVDALLESEIQQRREQENNLGEDILSLLLTAQDETGQRLSNSELRDELMTLLIAGHETTAWAFYWLHFLPEVETKLRRELSSGGDVVKLPYLNAVCAETLRIYPITATTFTRMSNVPLEMMGYQIGAGAIFAPCIYLVHHREDIYPEPEKFQPERFLERQFSPYEYLPFGGGNRRCLGAALALLEMKVVLATILQKFTLELINPRRLQPVRRGLTLAPPHYLKLRVKSKY
jgi:cytochrome P450